MMKAFQVDESHWYAGETAEQAVAAYIADCGEEVREYVEEFGEPQEETNMDKHIAEDDKPDGWRLGDLLATMDKPGFIGSTEY